MAEAKSTTTRPVIVARETDPSNDLPHDSWEQIMIQTSCTRIDLVLEALWWNLLENENQTHRCSPSRDRVSPMHWIFS